MTITKTQENDTLTLNLQGRLDTTTAPQLEGELGALDGVKNLVLDFEGLEYISSAGLRQVAAASRKAREMGASFQIIHAGCEVMSIFKMTGLDRKFSVTGK